MTRFVSLLIATSAAMLIVSAGVAQTPASPPAPGGQALAMAWQRVALSQTWSQQAHEVRAFLRAMAVEGRRPADLSLDARNIASGRAVSVDDPNLLQRPQEHEVTVTLDGRFYVFRPQSRAALEPLIRR